MTEVFKCLGGDFSKLEEANKKFKELSLKFGNVENFVTGTLQNVGVVITYSDPNDEEKWKTNIKYFEGTEYIQAFSKGTFKLEDKIHSYTFIKESDRITETLMADGEDFAIFTYKIKDNEKLLHSFYDKPAKCILKRVGILFISKEWFYEGLKHRENDYSSWEVSHHNGENKNECYQSYKHGVQHSYNDKPSHIYYGKNNILYEEAYHIEGVPRREDITLPSIIFYNPEGTITRSSYTNEKGETTITKIFGVEDGIKFTTIKTYTR